MLWVGQDLTSCGQNKFMFGFISGNSEGRESNYRSELNNDGSITCSNIYGSGVINCTSINSTGINCDEINMNNVIIGHRGYIH